MSNYTYEFENRNERLEQYEWDNVWWEQADIVSRARVLYVGDSISCQTRRIATEVSKNTLLFDGFGTSKAVDNPYFPDSVKLFAKQASEYCAILFNSGLHGWHLDDGTEYKQNYEKMVQFFLKEFEGIPVILVLTTAVSNQERNARVLARNKAVSEIAEAYDLPVIDLYGVTDSRRDLISADGVHLSYDGYRLLACELVDGIKKVVDTDKL